MKIGRFLADDAVAGWPMPGGVRPSVLLLSWLKLDAVSFHPFPDKKRAKKSRRKEETPELQQRPARAR